MNARPIAARERRLPHRFLYTELKGRCVWVDVRGILEALRRLYDAKALADEIAGGS